MVQAPQTEDWEGWELNYLHVLIYIIYEDIQQARQLRVEPEHRIEGLHTGGAKTATDSISTPCHLYSLTSFPHSSIRRGSVGDC